MIPESTEGGFNRSRWQYHLRESLLFYWEPQFTPQQADDVYQAFDWFYTPWPVLEDEELNRQVFNDVCSLLGFNYGIWFIIGILWFAQLQYFVNCIIMLY